MIETMYYVGKLLYFVVDLYLSVRKDACAS